MKFFQLKAIARSVLWLSAPAFGLGVYVDQEANVSKQVLKLPFAFWNEKFGFSVGYVYRPGWTNRNQGTDETMHRTKCLKLAGKPHTAVIVFILIPFQALWK